jgi:hypothetical protein
MANNTFLALYTELGDRLNLDYTQATYKTKLQRWINMSQQLIAGRFPFSWQLDRMIVQTVVDKTAGTVTFTNGSTSATGTSTAFAAADIGKFINPTSSVNWFKITNVSGQTLTLDVAYNETTVTGAYTVRQRYYDLASNVERVFTMTQTDTNEKLTQMGIWTTDTYQPDQFEVSVPTSYYMFGNDPSVAVSGMPIRYVSFFPSPDAVYNIEVKFLKYISDLSNDTDIPVIPQTYFPVLLQYAEWMGEKYLNGDEAPALEYAEMLMAKMIEQETSHDDYFPVLSSTDDTGGTRSNFLPFPSAFQQP